MGGETTQIRITGGGQRCPLPFYLNLGKQARYLAMGSQEAQGQNSEWMSIVLSVMPMIQNNLLVQWTEEVRRNQKLECH